MSKNKKAILALIVANIIWGAAAPIFKWSLHDIHPFTLAFLRFAIPAVGIGIYLRGRLKIRWKDSLTLFLAGFFGITINIGAFFLGIERTASINSPIISSAGPAFLILGAVMFLGERPKRKMLVGNLVSLTGVLLIVAEPLLHTTPSASIAGNMLLILATVGATAGTLFVKDIAKKYNALTIAFWTFTIGAVSFLFPFLQETHQYGLLPQLHFAGIIGIVFGAIFSSFIGYTFLYWALHYLLASDSSIFTYMDPIIAVLIAAPLVHEYPSVLFVVGAATVFFGVYIAEKKIPYHPIHRLFR